jgi:integrase
VHERPPNEELYCNLAWDLCRPDVLVPDGRVCPFRGPSFQLMRNLALARAKSAPRSVRANRAAPAETVHSYWGMLSSTSPPARMPSATGPSSPRYTRAREPHIFLPDEVERIRAHLQARDRTLVSVLAYSGPRPEEVVCRLAWGDVGEQSIRYVDSKRRRIRFSPLLTPLAQDLREWFLASGRPAESQPVFPAHNGRFWDRDDWRNWRKRIWQGEPERRRSDRSHPTPARTGCAPAGTRPRDLRSSFVTLRVYEGIPLTQIAREVGTSVRMIEEHYAGVIANWDGKRVPAERQIRAARRADGLTVDSDPKTKGARD